MEFILTRGLLTRDLLLVWRIAWLNFFKVKSDYFMFFYISIISQAKFYNFHVVKFIFVWKKWLFLHNPVPMFQRYIHLIVVLIFIKWNKIFVSCTMRKVFFLLSCCNYLRELWFSLRGYCFNLLCRRWLSAILQMGKVKEVLSLVCASQNRQNFTHSILFALITNR